MSNQQQQPKPSTFAAAAAAAKARMEEREDSTIWEGCASSLRTGVYVGVFCGTIVLVSAAIKAVGSSVGIGGKS